MKIIRFQILLGIAIVLLNGCAITFPPVANDPARLGPKTEATKRLEKLPPPAEKIVATVYKFRDQTGQYKNTATGTSWSTAVTQGATSILLKALEESNWFVVIEREGLSNLLNERKIIRSSRANYQSQNGSDQQLLPPLLYAGVLLEGGIISYDSNILTGGFGVKYFGAGASNQYREDRITIYLRAISTQSGRVLHTVYTTKTILSQMVDVGLYRFVNFKRLLEAETGYSYNEPAEMCVKEAIEKAIESLVIEGIERKLWNLEKPEDINNDVIQAYFEERANTETLDVYNRRQIDEFTFGIGLDFGMQYYNGDYGNTTMQPAGQLNIDYAIKRNFMLSLGYTWGQVADGTFFKSTINGVELRGNYRFLPNYAFCPIVFGGIGMVTYETKDRFGPEKKTTTSWVPQLMGGVGFEYFLFKNVGVNFKFDAHYNFNDTLDGVEEGKYNDFFWGGRAGFMFYF